MKSSRNQLILLGFIAQGLSVNSFLAPLFYALIWLVCVNLGKRPRHIPAFAEGLGLALGCLLGYGFSRWTGQSTHFFIGHGLVVVQAIRLIRPLTRRDKNFSILIACFHLAVGCSVVLDIRFLFFLAASIFLVPRALMELEAEAYPAVIGEARQMPGVRVYSIVIPTAILFFLIFPRTFLVPQLPSRMSRGGETGSLLDSVLDASGSANAQSARVILQVEADHLNYLRCSALTEFDGQFWKPTRQPMYQPLRLLSERELAGHLKRRVRVKQVSFLGSVLPTDANVVSVSGKFFRNPYTNRHGIVGTSAMWNSVNNIYEYWVEPGALINLLPPRELQRLTSHPPPSKEVMAFLAGVLKEEIKPVQQARLLEKYFQDHFTYRLGAPKLNRLNPIDDFLLTTREGHCERFASALAYLLRVQGIPSRVMIGYMPNSKSLFSGWYNIRVRDAHAWTEAYFPELGWVTLDATPRANGEFQQSSFQDIFDTIDFIWYSRVVNFDVSAQQNLFIVTLDSIQKSARWTQDHAEYLIEAMGIIVLLVCLRQLRRHRRVRVTSRERLKEGQILAEHYYGKMLRSLQSHGYSRQPQQTPREFLAALQAKNVPFFEPAEMVTEFFCEMRYGGRLVNAEEESRLEKALGQISESLKATAPT